MNPLSQAKDVERASSSIDGRRSRCVSREEFGKHLTDRPCLAVVHVNLIVFRRETMQIVCSRALQSGTAMSENVAHTPTGANRFTIESFRASGIEYGPKRFGFEEQQSGRRSHRLMIAVPERTFNE